MSLIKHGMFRVPNLQQGFTLVEILVAVLVLTIGLLGLAGLQATTMRFNHSAYMRSQATNLAYDIADRMRVNRNEASLGEYDGAIEDPPPTCTNPVLSGDLASQDIQEWRNALACTLPSGKGSVSRNGNIFTITIQWDDSRDSSNLQNFIMMTEI
jgi:type IV pilus assembly protein PilV